MSERKWPKEPWLRIWADRDGEMFVETADFSNSFAEAEEQRARDCVNALAGVRDPEGWVRDAKLAMKEVLNNWPGSSLAERIRLAEQPEEGEG